MGVSLEILEKNPLPTDRLPSYLMAVWVRVCPMVGQTQQDFEVLHVLLFPLTDTFFQGDWNQEPMHFRSVFLGGVMPAYTPSASLTGTCSCGDRLKVICFLRPLYKQIFPPKKKTSKTPPPFQLQMFFVPVFRKHLFCSHLFLFFLWFSLWFFP